ncbi:hypothetical protein HID58_023923 [Brassica napus]|uniref:Uncharacterized protein n=1 Tax=Brassica napus TaxID=3708 RepID=A0ABQ8D5Z6_BRANA|nr:hypothetical protein HID58_057675 [Brassica napus]KAH0905696.1 hypothetical protein HID58_037523 [Brassica napus]KAH0923905.1 hypothetical protein HID58_023923 [Brassica napus]
MKVINLLSRGIAVDSINGGENEDEPEKKKEIDSFLLPPGFS